MTGTNLRLKNFALLQSAAGRDATQTGVQTWYDFDFLDVKDGNQGSLVQFVSCVLDLAEEDMVAVAGSLQGRPRFAASAIARV